MKWSSRLQLGTSLPLFLAMSTAMATPANALETSLQYVLTLSGNVERQQVRYECEQSEELLEVEYVNAAPNFLAILPIGEEPEPAIFASVLSASGVRYASGFYIWWTKGAEATLYDLRIAEGSEDDPMPSQAVLTCLEYNDIP